MIEIEAEILRGSCTPVFFVGETVECEIRFKCMPDNSSNNNVKLNKKPTKLTNQSSVVSQQDSSSLLIQNESTLSSKTTSDRSDKMFSLLSNSNMSSSMSLSTIMSPTSAQNLKLSKSFLVDNSTPQQSSLLLDDSSSNSKQQQQQDATTLSENESASVAWACAQIDCHCYIDESKVILPKDPIKYNTSASDKPNEIVSTSFQPNKDRLGISVYSSKPKILFCNLTLRHNQIEKFTFSETLPYDLAPTFRGQFAKYTYKLTIGAQLLNKTTQLLRLPFRVYSLLDFEKYIPRKQLEADLDLVPSTSTTTTIMKSGGTNVAATATESAGSESNAMAMTNKSSNLSTSSDSTTNSGVKLGPSPFKKKESYQFESLEYSLQILEDITSRLSPNTYNVTNQDGKIVKVSLNKTNFKIGDKIVVILDFSESEIPCIEFKATLQSEEIIAEECRKKAGQSLASVHSHTELKEYTLYKKKTDFTLQIPVHITPTFVSDIISLRWKLHFDFALSKTPIQKIHKSNDAAMSLTWRPPSCLSVEVLSWDLPIVIHPFDPFIASDLIYLLPQTTDTNKLVLK